VGVREGVMFSFPVTCSNGQYEIVQGLDIDEFSRSRLRITEQELLDEREVIKDLLPAG